jgi:hypothetical protein
VAAYRPVSNSCQWPKERGLIGPSLKRPPPPPLAPLAVHNSSAHPLPPSGPFHFSSSLLTFHRLEDRSSRPRSPPSIRSHDATFVSWQRFRLVAAFPYRGSVSVSFAEKAIVGGASGLAWLYGTACGCRPPGAYEG